MVIYSLTKYIEVAYGTVIGGALGDDVSGGRKTKKINTQFNEPDNDCNWRCRMKAVPDLWNLMFHSLLKQVAMQEFTIYITHDNCLRNNTRFRNSIIKTDNFIKCTKSC